MSGVSIADAVYVDSQGALDAAVAALERAKVVAFDTEFIGESTYEPVLCLLQVATEDGVWVIDPLARLDLRRFWAALTAPDREVVALAARQEILFCLRYAGRAPARVFDPQLAAGLVGYGYPLSHTNLVQRVLGERVDGGETYTDWRRRPLTKRQLDYAASDVVHLVEIRRRLLARAESLGRVDWLEREAEQLVTRVVESERAERWWRVSSAGSLNRRELAVLRELWLWRDAAAREADQPARRVLGDDLLIAIARRKPQTTNDLFALRGLERPNVRRAGNDIVQAVRRGLAVPDAELPQSLRRDDPPQLQALVQLISVVTAGLAARHQVDNALLATNADLQDLVRWHLHVEGASKPDALEGWRGEILGRPLLDVLSGRSAIRVENASSSTPLRIDPI